MNANADRIIESRLTQLKQNSKETVDISSFLCQSCGSPLLLSQMSETKHMLMCSNRQCIFPFDCEDMKQFICDSNNLNGFLREISKLFSRPSTQENSHSDNDIFPQLGQGEYFNEEEEDEQRLFPDDY